MELPHQEQPVIGSLAPKTRPGDDMAAQSSHAASSDTETEEGQACREDGEGATSSEQASGPKQDTYQGVHKRPWGSYSAEIQDGSSAKRRIGTYHSAEAAARAYDAAAFMLHGAKARTNFHYSQEEVAQLSSMDHARQQLLLQAGRIADEPAVGPPGSPLAALPRMAAVSSPAAMLSLPLQQHPASYPSPLQTQQQQQQQLPAHMAPGSHLPPGLNRPLAVAVPGGAAVARAGAGMWGPPSGSPKPNMPPHEQHHHQPPQKKWRGSKGKPLRACTKQELDAVLSQPVSTAQAARSPGPFTPKRPLLAVAATRLPGPGIAGGRSSSTGSPARSSGGAAGSPLSARHFGALAHRGQPQHLQPRSPLGNGNPFQAHPQYFAAGRPGSPPLHAVAAIAAAVAAVANRASQSPDAASSTPRTPTAAAAAAAAMAAAAGMSGGRGMELQASPTAAVAAANSKVWPEPQAAAEPLRLNTAPAGAREALSSSSAAFSGDTHMQQQRQQAVDSPMVGSPMVASSWKTGNAQKEEPRAMPPQQLQPQPRTPREAPATGPAAGLYPIRTNGAGAPVAGAKQRYQGPLPIMPCSYSPLRRQPTQQQQAQQGGFAAQQVHVPPPPSAAAAAGAGMAGAIRTPVDTTPPPAAVTAPPPPTGVAALARQASDTHQLPAQKAVLVERVLDQIFLHESHLTDWGRQLLLTMAESLVPQSLPALRALAAASSAYHRSMAAPGGPGPTPWPYNQPPPGTATAAGATAAAAAAAPAGGAVSPGLWTDARPAPAISPIPAADPAFVAKAAEVKEEEGEAAQGAGWVGDLRDLVALQQGLQKRRSKRRRIGQLPVSASAIIAEVAAGGTDAQEAVGSGGGVAGVLPTAEPQLQQQSLSQLPRRPARGTIGSVQLFKAAPALDAGAVAAAATPARQQPAAQLWQAAAQEVGHVVSCGNLQALAEAASLFGEASLSHGLK